jgi:ankyrin repeat protein
MKTLSMLLITAFLMLPGPVALRAQEIFDAIRGGNIAKVKELVEKDLQLVKARNARQSTPLHVAVDSDNESMTRYLIEKGSDVNALNSNEWTPLFYAKTINIARLLVDKGADIHTGMPLAWMLATGRKDVAELLLDRGAGLPEIGTNQSLLFLVRSLRCGSIRFLEKYLQQGFDPLYESLTKSNLLHYASESDSAELIDRLIGLDVPANKTNMFGWRPLHIAAANGRLQTVKSLLKKDPDPNARTNDGKTPYNLAVEAKKDEIVEYLKSIGADQGPPRFPELRGEYMGQPRAGKKAVPFAPGILSPLHEYHGAITFTPDGNEMYWSGYADDSGPSIWHTKRENGKWREPELFSKGDVPFISPDGKKLYFVASKPVQGGTKEIICVRDRTASGWSEPKELPEIINSMPRIHWQVSVDNRGNLYFGASSETGSRIYSSGSNGGAYGKPQMIAGLKDLEAFSPYIAPDGGYLIITKAEGGEELSIHFKKKDGTWTKGIELSNDIGIKGAFCPIVTPDGKYLFFVCNIDGKYAPFWVDALFIQDLRKEALKDDNVTARGGRS